MIAPEIGAGISLSRARLALRDALCVIPKDHPERPEIEGALFTVEVALGKQTHVEANPRRRLK